MDIKKLLGIGLIAFGSYHILTYAKQKGWDKKILPGNKNGKGKSAQECAEKHGLPDFVLDSSVNPTASEKIIPSRIMVAYNKCRGFQPKTV